MLRAIERTAEEHITSLLLRGDLLTGSDLGAFEELAGVVQIWTISRDLKPDIQDKAILLIAAKNMLRGKKYNYVVPDYLPDAIPCLFKLLLKQVLEEEEKKASAEEETKRNIVSAADALIKQVEFFKLSSKDHGEMFSGGSIVIYDNRTNPRAGDAHIYVFEEAIIPNKGRGSLYQRQDDIRANMIINIVRNYTNAVD